VPSLQEVLSQNPQSLPAQKVPFDELYRYVELVHEVRNGGQQMLVQNDEQHFLAIFGAFGESERLV
jgi:hypothetical protein